MLDTNASNCSKNTESKTIPSSAHKFVSLDLELNQPSNKIIEIGCTIGSLTQNEPDEMFSIIINPNEPLDEFIINLTGITEYLISAHGKSLEDGYTELCERLKQHSFVRNAITWGGGDSQLLQKQLGLKEDEFVFARSWYDVKKIYQFYRLSKGLSIQSGLAKSMGRCGLKFKGKQHSALWDSYNTWVMAKNMLNVFK